MAGDVAGLDAIDRLHQKLDRAGDCWVWTGHTSGGYGRIRCGGGKRVQAHRYSYEYHTGHTIPEGLHLDHLCRNQRCCNPEHLEPVTPKENTNRGMAPSSIASRTGMCSQGHSNWHTRPNGKRECRTCTLNKQRARRTVNRDKINAQKRAAYRRKVGV